MLQPAQGSALYRVVGAGASQIFGRLSATGNLFLINPNGILFAQGAQVDVGSLVATSMNLSNANFLSSNYQFNANGGTGSVVNQGAIKVADGGYLVLLAHEVKNSGTLIANNGSVVMGSAESAILDFYGNGLIQARLSGDALSALVEQTGTIQAAGGFVQLASNSRSSAVNVAGVVQADSLVERNGVIRLEGGNQAKVSVAGTLSAAGKNLDTKGGSITVTGEQVALLKQAKLDASGNAGGGEVLVGGDYQGNNPQLQNARTTYVDKDATIAVDAKLEGNGGNVTGSVTGLAVAASEINGRPVGAYVGGVMDVKTGDITKVAHAEMMFNADTNHPTTIGAGAATKQFDSATTSVNASAFMQYKDYYAGLQLSAPVNNMQDTAATLQVGKSF